MEREKGDRLVEVRFQEQEGFVRYQHSVRLSPLPLGQRICGRYRGELMSACVDHIEF